MIHLMRLKEPYFSFIKQGEKTIELRLFDEKRQTISTDDEIVFQLAHNENETIKTRVINLYHAPNFEKLSNTINPQQAGFLSKSDMTNTMALFYPQPQQEKYGVLGIEIKKID